MNPFVGWARSVLNAHDTTLAESNLLDDGVGRRLLGSKTLAVIRANVPSRADQHIKFSELA